MSTTESLQGCFKALSVSPAEREFFGCFLPVASLSTLKFFGDSVRKKLSGMKDVLYDVLDCGVGVSEENEMDGMLGLIGGAESLLSTTLVDEE